MELTSKWVEIVVQVVKMTSDKVFEPNLSQVIGTVLKDKGYNTAKG